MQYFPLVCNISEYLTAFLFPQALYFCVHGILAHSLLISWLLRLCKPLLKRRRELLRYHCSQLAAGVVAWSGTHDVLVLSRKPGPSAWVGCARHSSSASRCCEERRATGHVSARKSTTAAAAEAEPKKTPPRKRVGSGGTTRLSPEGRSVVLICSNKLILLTPTAEHSRLCNGEQL